MKVNLVCFFSLFTLFMPAFASAEPIVPTVSAISELAKALISEKISV
ncbi:MAG: flagella basal body P-ring formation protein FlgA, partial [Shewanella sp.]